jgi:hypothetical protein
VGVVADLGGWHLDGEARRVAREPQGTCPECARHAIVISRSTAS